MSTALTQSMEELLVTTFTRMTEQIKAETDPKRLETLFTLALRARIPRALAPEPPTKRGRAPEPADQPDATPPAPRLSSPTQSSEASPPLATAGTSPFLAAAGPGVSRRGERLVDAPSDQPSTAAPTTLDQPASTPSTHSAPSTPSASRAELRRKLFEMPIEEFLKDAVAEAAAELAARSPEPPPFIFATEYLVRENYISHPRHADGTLQPLVEIPPGGIRPTKLEYAVMAVRSANYAQQLFENRRARLEAKAARAAAEQAMKHKRQSARARKDDS